MRVYRLFKKAAGGADGGVEGVNGSVSPLSLHRILTLLRIHGRRLVDLGAGEGRVLVAAIACGALKAFGHELPANRGHWHVFKAALVQLTRADPEQEVLLRNAGLFAEDIDKVMLFRCLFFLF